MQALKKFKEVKAPVKLLKNEKWTVLHITSRMSYLISTKGRIYSYFSDRCLKFGIKCGVHTFDFTPLNPKKTPDGQDGLPVKPQKNGKVSITS